LDDEEEISSEGLRGSCVVVNRRGIFLLRLTSAYIDIADRDKTGFSPYYSDVKAVLVYYKARAGFRTPIT
jgi:hypothetical protein